MLILPAIAASVTLASDVSVISSTTFSGKWGRASTSRTSASVEHPQLVEVHLRHGQDDRRDGLAVLHVDRERLLAAADALQELQEHEDAEPRALGGVDGGREGLEEGGVGAGPGDAVEDARLLPGGHLDPVAHGDGELAGPGVEADRDPDAALAQALEVVAQVLGGLAPEVLHAQLVVGVRADVEALLLEVDALGVGLPRVDDELLEAVGQRLLQALLAELAEPRLEDPVEQAVGLVGEAGEPEAEGDAGRAAFWIWAMSIWPGTGGSRSGRGPDAAGW